jgi:pimeloyl-ACP methyl ester carboxylesterase
MPQNLTPKGDAGASEYEQFVKASLEEMKPKANISSEEVRAEAGPIPAQEKGIQNWRLTQALARLLDRRCADITSFTIEMFLRDVFLYITDAEVTRQINAIINDKLTKEPTVVVAHSLGTVVAFRVLLEQRARINIRRFITVGSPLGIHTISSRLGMLEYPRADLLWYNAYDKRDIVALNPLKDPDFETDPVINNFGEVKNQTENRHGIIGYLNDATVAKSVAEALSN